MAVFAQADGFTVRDALSAPYAWALTAAPAPSTRFAWIENAAGVRNIWVASPTEPAHAITRYTADDGQDITGLAWSPDGQQLAFALGAERGASGKPANPAELQTAAASDTGQEIFIATASGDHAVRHEVAGHSPLFSRDGRTIFYIQQGRICARPNAAVASPDRASPDRASPDHTPAAPQPLSPRLVFDRGSASALTLSPDGRLLAYVSHRGAHSFIGLFDLEAHTLRFVAPSTGVDSAPSFSRDGGQLAWLRAPATQAPEFAANRTSAVPWSVMVADVSTLTPRTVYTPAAGKPGSVLPRFAVGDPRVWWAAGDTLLFCSEADGWNHLYAIDARLPSSVTLPAARLLTPLAGEVEDVSVSADGKRVFFAANVCVPRQGSIRSAAPAARGREDQDRRHLWTIDLEHGGGPRLLPISSIETAGIETRPIELADGSVAALASDTRVPMHPILFATDGRERDVRGNWLPEAYPGESFVQPRQVIFRSSVNGSRHSNAGLSAASLGIHGQLFLPKASKGQQRSKYPAILFFHGGPRRQMLLGYPAMAYYSNAYAMNQWFAAHGYVVLSVNYRCGIGYGLDFRQCAHTGADGAAEDNDALAAAAYLRSRPDVDARRIGIWGGSYGGYFVALGLARDSRIFRAGVDFHGIYDWTLEDNAPADWLRGSEAERAAIAARAKASSPIASIDRWKSPVLLIHGDDDPEVAFAQTPANADALRARGVHVEELIFPDEVHEFLLHRDWVRAYEAMVDFFARELR